MEPDTLLGRVAPAAPKRGCSREREIVRLAVGGLRNRAIADRLSISEGTVKVHMHNIYDKLDVNGRLELANYARDNGLI